MRVLATAVNLPLLRHLPARSASPIIFYLDPDIKLYATLEEANRRAREHGLVLTPHILGAMPRDGRRVDEFHILAAGIYNLWFIAIGPTANGFIDWWWTRTQRDGDERRMRKRLSEAVVLIRSHRSGTADRPRSRRRPAAGSCNRRSPRTEHTGRMNVANGREVDVHLQRRGREPGPTFARSLPYSGRGYPRRPGSCRALPVWPNRSSSCSLAPSRGGGSGRSFPSGRPAGNGPCVTKFTALTGPEHARRQRKSPRFLGSGGLRLVHIMHPPPT